MLATTGRGFTGTSQHAVGVFLQSVQRLVFQRFEQAVQLSYWLLFPVELSQAIAQLILLAVEQVAIGQVQVQRITGVDAAGGTVSYSLFNK